MQINLNRRQIGLAALAGAIGPAVAPKIARAAQTAPAVQKLPVPPPDVGVQVAVLIDQNVTEIDFIGPWEAFSSTGGGKDFGFELFTVSPEGGRVKTSGNGERLARYSLADAPKPNVVVIPAQGGSRSEGPTTGPKVEWLKRVAPAADVILSVCTGNFLMARTGLLDGREATTHHGFYDEFETAFPKVRLARGRRFVDNGHVVSAGGLTSSIDGALHVIHRYFGDAEAARVAEWMEHDGDGWRTGLR